MFRLFCFVAGIAVSCLRVGRINGGGYDDWPRYVAAEGFSDRQALSHRTG